MNASGLSFIFARACVCPGPSFANARLYAESLPLHEEMGIGEKRFEVSAPNGDVSPSPKGGPEGEAELTRSSGPSVPGMNRRAGWEIDPGG